MVTFITDNIPLHFGCEDRLILIMYITCLLFMHLLELLTSFWQGPNLALLCPTVGYEGGYPGDQAPLAQAGYRRAAMVHQPNSLDSVDGEPLPFDPVPVRFDAGG